MSTQARFIRWVKPVQTNMGCGSSDNANEISGPNPNIIVRRKSTIRAQSSRLKSYPSVKKVLDKITIDSLGCFYPLEAFAFHPLRCFYPLEKLV